MRFVSIFGLFVSRDRNGSFGTLVPSLLLPLYDCSFVCCCCCGRGCRGRLSRSFHLSANGSFGIFITGSFGTLIPSWPPLLRLPLDGDEEEKDEEEEEEEEDDDDCCAWIFFFCRSTNGSLGTLTPTSPIDVDGDCRCRGGGIPFGIGGNIIIIGGTSKGEVRNVPSSYSPPNDDDGGGGGVRPYPPEPGGGPS